MKNTNARFVQDINRIVRVKNSSPSSMAEPKDQPIAPGRGIGEKGEAKLASGIASPLKEVAGKREYYEPELLTSSDGLFVMERQKIKKAEFKDFNGQLLEVYFSE